MERRRRKSGEPDRDTGQLHFSEPDALIPKGFHPEGTWRWNYASGAWEFCVGEEIIWKFSEAVLMQDKGRLVAQEDFIEVIEGDFLDTLIIRRIQKDPESIRAFLKEREIEL